MKLVLVNLYPTETIARYLLSSYVLKAYISRTFDSSSELKIDILNFNIDTMADKICEDIIKEKPHYAGYSCYTWNIDKVVKVIERLRENSDFMHILGGPEISLNRISSFPVPDIADYYVIGEGEAVLTNLLLYLSRKSESPETEVPRGVAYFNQNRIIYTENTHRITDLDEIPSVYLTKTLDESLYARQQAFLETQRGCRFKCKYCVYHKNLPATFFYSLERIYNELDYLIVEKEVMALRIFDSVFTSDLRRAKEIVRHLLDLKKKGIRLPWIYWEFTCNTVDEEFIALVSSLKECRNILNTNDCPTLDRPQLYSELLKGYTAVNSVGIQSFYGPALKAVGRSGVTNEKLKSFMKLCEKYNIVLKIDLIIGLPFETFSTYFEGLEFFLPFFENTDHILNIHRLQLLPGSELETLSERYEMDCSAAAQHYVLSTSAFSRQELDSASRLSAVLFRILNSPLRSIFFETRKRTGTSFYELIKSILEAIKASEQFTDTQLVKNDLIHDGYWNKGIFKEIPSIWLSNTLRATTSISKIAV